MLSIIIIQEGASGAADQLSGLHWIDIVGLVLVGVFLVLGAIRGLWWQVFRLVGVIAAVAVARAVTPRLLPTLSAQLPDLDPRITSGIVFVLLFIVVLALAALVGRLGRKSLKAMQLSTLDRVGGAVAGVLTGALIHIAFVVAIDHFGPDEWSERTLAGTFSKSATDAIGAELPAAYAAGDEKPKVR